MRFVDTLASYLPSLVVHHLTTNENPSTLAPSPSRQSYDTVCLFCDISNFTALSESMNLNGLGPEGLASHLNSYFGLMCRLIAANGGDVFKFAGDACIVLWNDHDNIHTRVMRAVQCAHSIQNEMHAADLDKDNNVQLSVKCGIGIGTLSVLHIGGVRGRMEYLAVGSCLLQAFQAEKHSLSGQIICSKEAFECVKVQIKGDHTFEDGYVKLDRRQGVNTNHVKKKNLSNQDDKILESLYTIEEKIKKYIPGAVIPNLNADSPDDEKWGNEVRKVCILFVNLGIKEQQLMASARYDEAMNEVHNVLCDVQKSVYKYEGAINKFLYDDKGSTLIACFGLPPGAHEDDCQRGVLAALQICETLWERGLYASCGVTYGEVFCGIIGTRVRREYTVLGDCVNLSARLMQVATAEGGGVLCDESVTKACGSQLLFTPLDPITVKGKVLPIKIFRPYPPDRTNYPIPHTNPAYQGLGTDGPNLYRAINMAQKEYVSTQHSLTFLQAYLRHNEQRLLLLYNKKEEDAAARAKLAAAPRTPLSRLGRNLSKSSQGPGPNLGPNNSLPNNSLPDADSPDSRWRTFSNESSQYSAGSFIPPAPMLSMSPGTPTLGSPGTPGTPSSRKSSILKGRRNSHLSLKSTIDVQADVKPIHRPTLTPSGLVPIHLHHATSSSSQTTTTSRQSFGYSHSHTYEGGGGSYLGSLSDHDRDSHSLQLNNNNPNVISITVPLHLSIDNLRADSPVLTAISMEDASITTFTSLKERAKQMAFRAGYITADDARLPVSQFAFNILGTRSFLPDEDEDFEIKWLPAFMAVAFCEDMSTGDFDNAVENLGVNGLYQQGVGVARGHARTSSICSINGSLEGSGKNAGLGSGKTFELTLIKEMDKLNVQSRLCIVRRKLLVQKIKLTQDGKGSVVILEGEPGCGKTEAMAEFVAKTLPGTAPAYVTHAPPFCGHVTEFGAWGVVVQQFLDLLVSTSSKPNDTDSDTEEAKDKREDKDDPMTARTTVMLSELESSLGSDVKFSWLLNFAYLLNPLCNTRCPIPSSNASSNASLSLTSNIESASAPKKLEIKLIIKSLLLRLLGRMSASSPTVIIFDDAMYLGPDSWSLALAVSESIAESIDSNTPLRLMVVFSLRPIANYRARYEAISPEYQELVDVDAIDKNNNNKLVFLKLDGLPPEDVEDFVCSKLGSNVISISEQLYQLMEERAMGNPFVVTEIIGALQRAENILIYEAIERVSEDNTNEPTATATAIGHSSSASVSASSSSTTTTTSPSPSPSSPNNIAYHVGLREGFQTSDIPLVPLVMSILGARLDRLNVCQQNILKVASVLTRFTPLFKWSALYHVYPVVGHKSQLWKEIVYLEDIGILMESPSGRSDHNTLTGDKDYEFRFSFSSICDTVQSRILKEQKTMLIDAVTKYDSGVEKARRQEHMERSNSLVTREISSNNRSITTGRPGDSGTPSFCTGTLHIQRKINGSIFTMKVKRRLQSGGLWKDRYCVLTPTGLHMYRETSTPGSEKTPTQIIYLKGAKAEVEKQVESFGVNYVFRLDALKWEKNGKVEDGRRSFVVSAPSKANLDNWLYMIHYAIESIENNSVSSTKGRVGSAMSRRSLPRGMSTKSIFKSPQHGFDRLGLEDPETLEGEGDLRLVVTVKRGRGLVNTGAFGTSNPYCEIVVDDQHCRTRTPLSASIDPEWSDEHFVFPLELHQWVRSNLKLQLFNRDVYLSDDCLGYAEIKLSSLSLEELPEGPGSEGDRIGENLKRKAASSRSSRASSYDEELVKGDAGGSEIWLNLALKSIDSKVRGEVLIHVSLHMTNDTMANCKAAGGTENFKRQLQLEAFEKQVPSRTLLQEFKGDDDEPGGKTVAVSSEESRIRQLTSIGFVSDIVLKASPIRTAATRRNTTPIAGTMYSKPVAATFQKVRNGSDTHNTEIEETSERGNVYMNDKKILKEKRDEYKYNASTKMASPSSAREAADEAMTMKSPITKPVKRRHSANTGANGSSNLLLTSRSANTESEAVKLAKRKIQDLLLELPRSGAMVERDWISSHLKSVMKDLSNGRAPNSTLANIVEKAGLDDKDKQWLEVNYSRQETSTTPEAKTVSPRELDNFDINASSKSSFEGKGPMRRSSLTNELILESSFNSNSSGGMGRTLTRSTSEGLGRPLTRSTSASHMLLRSPSTSVRSLTPFPIDTESFVQAIVSQIGEEEDVESVVFHYLDENSKVQGPFTTMQMVAWFDAGYMHEQVMVSVGDEPWTKTNTTGSPFVPLSLYIDAMKSSLTFASLPLVSWAEKYSAIDKFKVVGEADGVGGETESQTRQFWQWGFNIFLYGEDELGVLAIAILEGLNIPLRFKVQEFSLLGFMDNVRHLMTRNGLGYHNYYHALDVMQTCYVFVNTFEAGAYFTDLEKFGLAVAAVCHDLDHPGLNNAYQVNKQTKIALKFNDASVLENMHAYLCFSILRKNGCNIFSGLEKGNQVAMRKLIIGCILHTDMTFHFSLKNDLNACVAREAEGGGSGAFMKNDKDRDVLLKTLLHVADISNPCKPWILCKKWSDRVLEEFFHQGDVEESEGFDVSANMCRKTTNQNELSLNFNDFIVAPFFISLVNVMPKLLDIVRIMVDNRDKWDERHFEVLRVKNTGDEVKGAEDMAKWEKRATAFRGAVQAVFKKGEEDGEGDGDEEEDDEGRGIRGSRGSLGGSISRRKSSVD